MKSKGILLKQLKKIGQREMHISCSMSIGLVWWEIFNLKYILVCEYIMSNKFLILIAIFAST